MKNNFPIPIAMASDNKYMPYTYVAVFSLLKNKQPDTTYIIHILHTSNIEKRFVNHLSELVKKYQCLVNFIDMRDSYKDQKSQLSHISHVTFYRLQLPKLLKNTSKIIWLDGDIIVQKDLTELYNIDINNCYIAAIKDAYNVRKPEYSKEIGASEYVNAGVVVWNLKKMREDNLCDKFEELSKNTYRFMDQDIINISCSNKIKLLSLKYNAMSNFFERDTGKLERMYYNFVNKEDRFLNIDDLVIIHYCTYDKPWNKKFFLGEIWWKYAVQSPYGRQLKHEYLNAIGELSAIEKVFSVKNVEVYKQFCILGFKFKIKTQKLVQQERFNQIIKNQKQQINLLRRILKVYEGKIS